MSLADIKEISFLVQEYARACVLIKWFVRVLKMSTVYGSITVTWLFSFFLVKLNCQKSKRIAAIITHLGLCVTAGLRRTPAKVS